MIVLKPHCLLLSAHLMLIAKVSCQKTLSNPKSKSITCFSCDSEIYEDGQGPSNPLCTNPRNPTAIANQIKNSNLSNGLGSLQTIPCEGVCSTEINSSNEIYRICLTWEEFQDFFEVNYNRYFDQSEQDQQRLLQYFGRDRKDKFKSQDDDDNHDNEHSSRDYLHKKAADGSIIRFCKSNLCNGQDIDSISSVKIKEPDQLVDSSSSSSSSETNSIGISSKVVGTKTNTNPNNIQKARSFFNENYKILVVAALVSVIIFAGVFCFYKKGQSDSDNSNI